MEAEYLDEIAGLTGTRPRDAWEGDIQLEHFVRSAGPELDGPLLQLLYRRTQRVYLIMRSHYIRYRPGKEME